MRSAESVLPGRIAADYLNRVAGGGISLAAATASSTPTATTPAAAAAVTTTTATATVDVTTECSATAGLRRPSPACGCPRLGTFPLTEEADTTHADQHDRDEESHAARDGIEPHQHSAREHEDDSHQYIHQNLPLRSSALSLPGATDRSTEQPAALDDRLGATRYVLHHDNPLDAPIGIELDHASASVNRTLDWSHTGRFGHPADWALYRGV